MKNKRNLGLILLLVVMMFTFSSCGADEPATDEGKAPVSDVVQTGDYDLTDVDSIELVLSSALSTNHGCWEGFYAPWMAAVEEKSDGKVSFQVFSAGELVEGGKEFDALRQGVIDVAAPLMPVYDTSRFPLSDVAMLPIGETNAVIGTKAYDLLVESQEKVFGGQTYYDAEFTDNDVFYIGHNIPPGSAINTTGKELNSVDDIKGLRIRTGSITTQMFAESVGMVPISMPAFELFDAMSRGAVDGSFIHVADWTAYGFQDLFKYSIEDLNFGHFTAGLGMTSDKFESLPTVVQQIIIDAAEEVKLAGAELWDGRTVSIKEETSAKGVKFIKANDLPEEVSLAINESIVATWEEYIATKGDDGKELAKLWMECVLEAGGTIPEDVVKLFE